MRHVWVVALMFAACSNGSDTALPADAIESCATYCSFSVVYCQNGNELFANPNDCGAACAAFPTSGLAGDTHGNTLQCRLTYLLAALSQPVAFCLDASPHSPSCQ